MLERAPRRVTVHAWEWLEFALPETRVRVTCSGGTYVRTLAHDLGNALGTGAALASLRRIRSEPFGLERAVTLAELGEREPAETWARAGLALEAALAHLPALALEAREAEAIGFGARPVIAPERAAELPVGAGPRSLVLRSDDGRVLALGELAASAAGAIEVRAQVVFPWSAREGRSQ
jgi:tRNA pseudouridine55 synthase